ncbi:unnamed protein product [Thlaspi arvense]|uniref:F-box associated beta-propeller type 1 domain-containing protein n=1 Tax=Thlaspi arvense TaxID=13288 RepID=A0AAU9RVX3_THLAR|nr:unnamed protein product [Thlaspi arvense]
MNVLESRELHSTPITPGGLRYSRTTNCDELLFCDEWSGGIRRTVLCNPWLRQTKRIFNIEYFEVFGIGYDNSGPEKVYKILGYSSCRHNEGTAIYDCASHALKFIDQEWIKRETAKGTIVSLNGNLYWITLDDETREHIIQCFDFPTERIKPLCLVPYQTNHPLDVLHLAQCNETRKVEVWLTNKVDEEELTQS